MLVGSAPSELKLGTTTVTGVRRGAGLIYDSDVAAFQKASGATQVGPILALVDYLKAQNLWSASRFYPMKSAQNAGSGSTVYGLGGLTANNMTLGNSPTWGSDGVTFASASSQHGTISDFLSDGTISFWLRAAITETNLGVLLAQFDGPGNDRSVQIFTSSSQTLNVSRSLNGIVSETYEDGSTPSQDTTISAEWLDGGGRTLWKQKDPQSLSLVGGSVQTSRRNSTAPISVMGHPAGANPTSGTVALAGVIETALTTTQRETITDLINAL
jgi:hypothetical protein